MKVIRHDPIVGDLGDALHYLLSTRDFAGAGHIRVSVSDTAGDPRYVVKIDLDAARVIAEVLGTPSQLKFDSTPVTWEFDSETATRIAAAAMSASTG
jgi:hypothetical protein